MVISLNEVADEPFLSRALILVVVALAITAGVYGAVALIVKMDDVGLHLAQSRTGAAASFGRGLVRGMPVVLSVLSTVGIAAVAAGSPARHCCVGLGKRCSRCPTTRSAVEETSATLSVRIGGVGAGLTKPPPRRILGATRRRDRGGRSCTGADAVTGTEPHPTVRHRKTVRRPDQ